MQVARLRCMKWQQHYWHFGMETSCASLLWIKLTFKPTILTSKRFATALKRCVYIKKKKKFQTEKKNPA